MQGRLAGTLGMPVPPNPLPSLYVQTTFRSLFMEKDTGFYVRPHDVTRDIKVDTDEFALLARKGKGGETICTTAAHCLPSCESYGGSGVCLTRETEGN